MLATKIEEQILAACEARDRTVGIVFITKNSRNAKIKKKIKKFKKRTKFFFSNFTSSNSASQRWLTL